MKSLRKAIKVIADYSSFNPTQLRTGQSQPAVAPLVALKEIEPFVAEVEPLGSSTKSVNDHYIYYWFSNNRILTYRHEPYYWRRDGMHVGFHLEIDENCQQTEDFFKCVILFIHEDLQF